MKKKLIIIICLIGILLLTTISVVYYKNKNSDMFDNSKNIEIKPIQTGNALLNTGNAPAGYKKLGGNTTIITISGTTTIPKNIDVEIGNFD